jgi:hypothetical protein
MTATNSDGEVSTDVDHVPDRAVPRERSRFRILLPVLICMLVGAEVGMGLGLLSKPAPEATARIQIVADPSLTGNVQDTSQANRFVQGEVIKLSGDDLQGQAQQATGGLSALDVTATQVEATDVVEIQVVAQTDADAVKFTQALVQAYADDREAAFVQGVDASIAVVDGQLKTLSKSSAPRSATNLEYTRLLGLKNGLELARDSDRTAVPVVLRPRVVEQSPWPTAVRDAFVGLVLGGLLGLLLKLVIDRSWSRRAEATRSWT